MRWPYLNDIPRFGDELEELAVSLATLQGGPLPLTNDNMYVSPLLNYAWLAAFAVLGPSPFAGRLVIMLAGVAAVIATYALGTELHSRPAGVIGALLLAANPTHVVIHSHIAWSNCVTPLFSTLGLWLLIRAPRSRGQLATVLSGLAFGIAIQTHISAIALVGGAALAVLITRPASAWSRLGLIWSVAVIAGYSNMIVFNLVTDFASLREATEVAAKYNKGEVVDLPALADRASMAIAALGSVITADAGGRGSISESESPVPWLHLGIAVAACLVSALKGPRLPLVWLAVSLIGIVLVNRKHEELIGAGRYVMPLFPVLAVLQGIMLANAGQWIAARVQPIRKIAIPLSLAVTGIVPAVLVTLSIVSLNQYYRGAVNAGATNAQLFRVAESAMALRTADVPVVMDSATNLVTMENGGCYLNGLAFLFTARGVPYEILEARDRHIDDVRRADGQMLMAVRRETFTGSPPIRRVLVWATNRRDPSEGRPPTDSETYFSVPRLTGRPSELLGTCEQRRIHHRLQEHQQYFPISIVASGT